MESKSYVGLPTIAVADLATTPNPGYPAVAYSSTIDCLVCWDGTRWLAQNPSFKAMLGANQTINSTVATTVTGFTFAVGAGERWRFECSLMMAVNATPDIIANLSAPAGTTGRYTLSSINQGNLVQAAPNVATATLALATGDEHFLFNGGIITTAAGNVSIQVRNATGATAQTIYAGSWMKAERIL